MDQSYKEEELFAAALALPALERVRYLARACVGEPQVLARLRLLLDASEDAVRFIKERPSTTHDCIEWIGPYRMLHELGEGGCGIAYLAEQTAPVKREVALKVIKPGMDTRAVIARFEAERQALAMMDHPNVAKVFDAGATSAGRPYFVMELVRGIRITDYCSQSRLSVRERLLLFVQVCHAIQHAHLKGIIHRDIKPSNVLVTMHDGASIAKVIDFGIAKAMQGRLTDNTVHTALEQFIGTPAYVSPEQTDPGCLDIDTRSDIYSLGVLLYELLTACTPFDTSGVTRSGLDQVRRLIREEEPTAPSKRLKAFGQGGAEVQVDLDWIVMRCLEKERGRRYQSVHELVLDVQRYLANEPVLARPPSVAYIFRKFARRHRAIGITSLAASAAAISILALVAMSDRISTERAHAEQEGERAHRVSTVMMDVLAVTDPFESAVTKLTPVAVLEAAERGARAELADQPSTQADMLEVIGRAYRRRGDFAKARNAVQDALLLRKQLSDSAATLETMSELILALRLGGELGRAQDVLAEAFAFATRRNMEGSASHAKLLRERGVMRVLLGNVDGGRQDLNEALILTRRLFGDQSQAVAVLQRHLSTAFLWAEDWHEAERFARRSIATSEAVLPAGSPDLAIAQRQLGEVLFAQNRWEEAAAEFAAALQCFERTLGEDTVAVANTLDSLAQVRQAQERLAEAEGLARRSVATYAAISGNSHPDTAYSRVVLGGILVRRSRFDEAEVEFRTALDVYRSKLPPDHQYVAAAEYWLGEALLATGRLSEAESTLTASMERWKRSGAPAWRAARSANALGEVLYRQGRTVDARRHLADSSRELEADPNAEPWAKSKSQGRMASYLHVPPPRVAQTTTETH